MKQKTKKELRHEIDELKDLKENYDHIEALHKLADKMVTANAVLWGLAVLNAALLAYQYFA